MNELTKLADWLYGDVKKDRGFWYSHPLWEIGGLTEEQLFWVPDQTALCLLWHVGHIAHRERTHIARFLQGQTENIIPPQYEAFGTEWIAADELRRTVGPVPAVFEWVTAVRAQSRAYLAGLGAEEFHLPVRTSMDLTVGHWLFITVAHGALHIGKIQVLRAMLEGKPDRPC